MGGDKPTKWTSPNRPSQVSLIFSLIP